MSDFLTELECLVRARYTAIHIPTFEEERCIALTQNLAQKLNKRVLIWTATNGFVLNGSPVDVKSIDFKTATTMARELGKEPSLFVWCDIHNFFKNQPTFVRCFRELCQFLRVNCPSNNILISPILDIPIELQKEITILDMPLPALEETRQIIKNFADGYVGKQGVTIHNDADTINVLSQAGIGLTQTEIENSLAKSLVQDHSLAADDVDRILQEKKQIIRKTGILEYIDTSRFDMSKIGGLQNLKNWLEKRKTAFTQEARDFGLDYPKGVLLVGIPGCGKSLSAKCIASAWKMPLLKLDMGKIFAGIVGSSEANMRSALQLSEAVSPSILWIDEIEKGLAGSSSGSSDGGTSTRVFGNLLTWMQEKQSPVFVFATANNIQSLPPELLRKGRFDEIFFIDLPSADERKDIFSIMIKECHHDPQDFNLDALVSLSGEQTLGEGIRLTGSEIEAVVKDALLEVFYRKSVKNDTTDMNTDDIKSTIQHLVPLAKSREDDIKFIRNWAQENAVRASVTADPKSAAEVSVGRNIEF
jgi:SpoVK/Ycf46/Vps4 family AAA+-type ATPase